MQRLKLVLAALLALPLVTLGCGPQAADTRHETAPPPAGAPDRSAQGSLPADQPTGVELGSTLGPDGDVTAGTTTFKAGEPLFAEIQASGLPTGSTLRLAWVGPQGQSVGTDELVVPPEARVITLKSKDTSSWSPGDYRLDVAVGGANVASRPFTIAEAGAAD